MKKTRTEEQPMHIAICDDDRLWNEQASNILNQFFQDRNESVEIICFESPDQMMAYQGPDVSVLFMDIEFDEADEPGRKPASKKGLGIESAGIINSMWPGCQIVYCSNYLNYALDVYETRHIYYVVKGQFRDRLEQIFEKMARREEYDRESVYLQLVKGQIVRLPVKDIISFERRARYTEVIAGEDSFFIREKIGEIADKLPEKTFTRCHNSYLLNMAYILAKKGNEYELKNGEHVPISRGYARSSREEFLDWCASRML